MIKPLEDKLIVADVKGMERKELEEFADRMRIDRNSFLLDNKPSTKLTLEMGMLERQLKDAWERNEVQNKYWHNIGVERNTLKERVEELETELYFCNRNKRVEEIVDERT